MLLLLLLLLVLLCQHKIWSAPADVSLVASCTPAKQEDYTPTRETFNSALLHLSSTSINTLSEAAAYSS
jgi:hypothetical protein